MYNNTFINFRRGKNEPWIDEYTHLIIQFPLGVDKSEKTSVDENHTKSTPSLLMREHKTQQQLIFC